jgi:hypothetical protein
MSASKQLKVTINEVEYTIPALNVGQLESVAEIISGPPSNTAGLYILKVALKRAQPSPDMETFSPSFEQIGKIVQDVLAMSGLEQKVDPQQAAA